MVTFHAEHRRHRGTVNIGVENAYSVAHSLQGDRQIGRDGAFPYASLGRTDRDNVLDPARPASRFRFFGFYFFRGCLFDEDRNMTGILRKCFGQDGFARLFQRCGERVAAAGKRERELDLVSGYDQVFNHTLRDEVSACFGVLHAAQDFQNIVLVHCDGCLIVVRKGNKLLRISQKLLFLCR